MSISRDRSLGHLSAASQEDGEPATVVVRGIRLVAGGQGDSRATLHDLRIADISGLGYRPVQLTAETLDALPPERVLRVTAFDALSVTLAASETFAIVLDGDVRSLPEPLAASDRHIVIADHADWLKRELLVHVQAETHSTTAGEDASTTTRMFAGLNTEPITGRPAYIPVAFGSRIASNP